MNKARTGILVFILLLSIALFCSDKISGINNIISRVFHPKADIETTFIRSFPFDNDNSLAKWKEKVFKGHVKYAIESDNGSSYVHAISKASCSAMYYEMKLDPKSRPFLSWKWRIGKFPGGEAGDDLSDKSKDDFAARVYVIFPALFFADSKVLEYVWAKKIPSGTIGSSPYSGNIKIMVLESGESPEWVSEERNLYKDYLEAFSEKPKLMIGAIALMCDSDSTKTEAEAFFDDIKVFYQLNNM